MKTRHIYGMIAGTLIAMSTAACSDNLTEGFEPVQKTLELAVDGHVSAFSEKYNAAQRSYDVNVESNTLWRVQAKSNGGWISLDKVSGRGNESFTFTLRDNMIERREGTITVYMVNLQGDSLEIPGSSIELTVSQEASSVRLSPTSLSPFKPTGNARTLFTVTANVAWTLDVSYEGENPTEFVTISPESGDMQASGNGTYSGDGVAEFYINVADNRTSSDRKAYLNLRSDGDVGSYSVEITQTKSEYNFDVSPSENQTFGASGGERTFGVLSIVGWSVESSATWVTFSMSLYPEGSDNRVETVATVAPNPTGEERSATLRFTPNDTRYTAQDVTIIQRGQDLMFEVSQAEGSAIIPEGGGSISLNLDSRFNWLVNAPEWMSINPGNGDASASISVIQVNASPNMTNDNRPGTVTITPLPTRFPGGITINPSDVGIGSLHVGVTQFGGREAAISVPWLRDDYTHNSATIEFNFYSPFHQVVEAGLEWGRADSDQRETMTVTPSDPTDCTVTFELTGLSAATKYVARGYVKDTEGKVKYGEWSYPFTTGGEYPEFEDNPVPNP